MSVLTETDTKVVGSRSVLTCVMVTSSVTKSVCVAVAVSVWVDTKVWVRRIVLFCTTVDNIVFCMVSV